MKTDELKQSKIKMKLVTYNHHFISTISLIIFIKKTLVKISLK